MKAVASCDPCCSGRPGTVPRAPQRWRGACQPGRRGRRPPAPRPPPLGSSLLGAAEAAGAAQQLPGSECCIELETPPGGARTFVFGAVHGDANSPPAAADFILEHSPAAVVVETALNPAHGAATGTVVRRADCLASAPGYSAVGAEPRARAFAQHGAALAAAPPSARAVLWRELSRGPRRLCGEQLAYVAAFAAGSDLVFGDRPKRVTYQRMLHLPSVADLDESFGLQSALNYHELASQLRPSKAGGAVEAIMICERDAVLLSSMHAASLAAGPGREVVGVVGASHLEGMARLWKGHAWRAVLDGTAAGNGDASSSRERGGVLWAPEGPPPGEPPEALGVRRALLESVVRLTCRADVCVDLASALPAPAPTSRAAHAYQLCRELYGTSRMLLAVLGREQLGEVCSGWRCDMWEVLGPLRAVRPINGGPGFDEELVLDLRTLNFEL